jgi:hypothetical protein
MEAKDLRIGNFVNLKNWQDEISIFGDFEISQSQLDDLIYKGHGFATILGIIKNEVEISAYGCDLDYYNFKEILPIHLTEEWLLKFGFIKIEKHHVFYISTINPMFKFCPDIHSAAWDNQMLRRVKIQYVHQLQNFFFALTGEELTVLQA